MSFSWIKIIKITVSYGPKGSTIIQAMLLEMFNPLTTPTDAIYPLSLAKFTEWYLVPHISTLWIAEDLGCTYETAWEERTASSNFGKNVYPAEDDDEEFDNVIQDGRKMARASFLCLIFDAIY
jgi:hypothetical protein